MKSWSRLTRYRNLDRRAQLYYSDSVSASADEAETDDDLVIDEENDLRTPRPGSSNHSYDAIVNNLAWDDEELAPGPSTPTPVREFLVARPSIPTTPRPSSPNNLVPRSAHERTPLLRQITPLTLPHRPFPRRPKAKRAGSGSSKTGRRRSNTKSDSGASRLVPTDTTVSSEPPKFISTGQSTFGQTVSRCRHVYVLLLTSFFSYSTQLPCCLVSACYQNPLRSLTPVGLEAL